MMKPLKNTILLSPAGSWESLHAAIKAGADAVYFGVGQLNMRARASKPFALTDLAAIADLTRDRRVESYLALNTLLYDDDLPLMRQICDAAKEEQISAVIATDIAAVTYARSIGLPVHISTQTNISNMEAVKYYARYADVMVLARELTLEQIEKIVQEIEQQNITGPSGDLVSIELFVHGALCVSISGKCGMSLATTGHSANRGDCLQPCRRSYRVSDEETGEELVIDNQFVMSPKDICMIAGMDKLINAGVRVFKIEGRGRSSEYVYHTTRAYRQAIDAVFASEYSPEKIAAWTVELGSVFNRGFWHGGYYLGKKMGEWAGAYGSVATRQKSYVGYALNYFNKAQIGQFQIENGEIAVGETIAVTGLTTGYEERLLSELFVNGQPATRAVKGDDVTIPFDAKLRRHDKLYVIRERSDWQS